MAGEYTFTPEPLHTDPALKETDLDRIVWRVLAGGLLIGMLALYCFAVWLDWLPWLRGWMNYPQGWTWALNPQPPLSSFIPLVCIIAGIWATVTLAELSSHSPHIVGMGAGGRTVKAAYLVVMVLLGYGLQLGLLGLKSDNANRLLVERVTNRVFTGYFTHATSVPNLESLLSGYPEVFETTICPHCHDHPPGPSLYYWLNIQAVTTLPDDWERNLANRTWQLVGESPQLSPLRNTLSDSHILGAFLGGTLILILSAMVVLPAYGLARRLGPRGYEFRLAALGLALPGLMLMAPEFDQVLALVSATALYLGLRGLASTRTVAVALSAWSAGAIIALGLLLSWAVGVMLAVLLALGLVCAAASRRALFLRESARPRMTLGEGIAWAAGLAAGVLLPLALLYFVGQVDLPGILQHNLANAQRAEAQRPHDVWLIFGPLDFVQFLGLPLALATLAALTVRPTRIVFAAQDSDEDISAWHPEETQPWYLSINFYTLLLWLTVFGLAVAGRSKAEQGRLLIFLMPLALAAVYLWAGRTTPSRFVLGALFFAQMAVCIVIGARWMVP